MILLITNYLRTQRRNNILLIYGSDKVFGSTFDKIDELEQTIRSYGMPITPQML